MYDVVSDEVWDFFCKRLPRNEEEIRERKEKCSEIEWLTQTEELKSRLVRSTVSKYDESFVMIRIPLMTQIFELKIRKSECFPEEPPEFSGEFIDGFHNLEWTAESTLYELSEKITDYCITVDVAILEIKEADSDGFHIVELDMDDEESGHLRVVLKATKYKEQLTLSLDVEDFRSFPRVLRCSNPSRTASFDCEKWISDDKLGTNLRRLYGELELNSTSDDPITKEIASANDSFEEVDEIMDFI
ncbi:hypothetical protein GCK72_006408 [Caenorhabditis remanei]|uniref:Uncharacterized protein n=1 Tax=Caenorhabditis remanei TaxID=31234 RepID=A0A6A5HHA8_CAERE|nr:hypothetical protein GCK72_006408 [Caenorhabditis remanei]KAF1766451.1 hypothetical protein GCK72_006408 [Caenorhabditis remanei]